MENLHYIFSPGVGKAILPSYFKKSRKLPVFIYIKKNTAFIL
jgi:hypothetical protein